MLQLVNDYRSLGIDLWLLAIVCSLIGRGHLLAAIIRAAVILARVRSSLGGYILLIGILLVLLVRILLIRILLVSLVIIIVGIIVIIHLITPVCLK